MWNDKLLTNIEDTAYEPHGSGMEVCVQDRNSLSCHCVAAIGAPGQLKRYLPSECQTHCNGSSGLWTPVQSGRCIQASSGTFCSKHECEQSGGNYSLQ